MSYEKLSIQRRRFLKAGLHISAAMLPIQILVGKERNIDDRQSKTGNTLALGIVRNPKERKQQTRIPTATGTILPSEMGITSVHEHIPIEGNSLEREKSKAFAIGELNKAKTLGLHTIVDVGPTEDVAAIR